MEAQIQEAQIQEQLTTFIVANFLFGDEARSPGLDESLVDGGVIDSTGVLELIEFLESNFGIEVAERETLPENLDSISNLTRYVRSKTAVVDPAV